MNATSTLYADTAQAKAWFAKAKPGARMIYAMGPRLDPKQPTVTLVQDWLAAKAVITLQERSDGVLSYLVQRRAVPEGEAERIVPKLSRDPEADDTPEGVMLRHISRFANLGLPCPPNPELARLCGLRDAEAARYRFNRLRDRGDIVVKQGGTFSGRRVMVVATGKWTAEPNGVAA